MGLQIGSITIDCADPGRLAEFWAAALAMPVRGSFGDFILLRPDEGGPSVTLQRVPEPRGARTACTSTCSASPGRRGAAADRPSGPPRWASTRVRA